jgi:hypothetical protein
MAVIGAPTDWVDLIDPMVPKILGIVLESWQAMAPPAADEKEDRITEALCRVLRQNRTARDLPFQIHLQVVELEPANGEGLGRLDIAFMPLVNREDIYFCLECKRLNVANGKKKRSYATEYVTFGMFRFVRGQYSQAVRHGGMAGYVLDGNVGAAMTSVEKNIQRQHIELGMSAPGTFSQSAILKDHPHARETQHKRAHHDGPFCLHHLFVSNAAAA